MIEFSINCLTTSHYVKYDLHTIIWLTILAIFWNQDLRSVIFNLLNMIHPKAAMPSILPIWAPIASYSQHNSAFTLLLMIRKGTSYEIPE